MVHRATIIVAEPVAPIVATANVLSASTDGSQPSAVGPNLHVLSRCIHGFSGPHDSQLAKIVSRRAMQRMIEAVSKPICPMLWVGKCKALVKNFSFIGATVAVSIASKK